MFYLSAGHTPTKVGIMFEILDKSGNVIDTANTLPVAQDVVTHMFNTKRDMAPYHCRPKAA
jgi:hypothetical protein